MPLDDPFRGVLPFFYTAELCSFGQAAQRLGISTPAVSRSVARLEERLGAKLLQRTSRAVTLTPEGALFRERCREALSSLEAGRQQLSATRNQPQGELRVTLSPILGQRVLQGMGRFTARYPKLRVQVTMTDRFTRLLEENLDIAIRVGGRQDSSLVQRSLLETRWVTLASPAYLQQHASPNRPAELEAHNCLRFVQQNGKPRDFVFRDPDTQRESSLEVAGNFSIDEGDHLLRAALAGLGVVQVLDFMVGEALQQGRLTALLEPFSAPGPKVFALMPKERSKSASVRAFLGFLLEEFRGRA
ncbi:MAG: LysR family transcriptional regulator [Polyangiaceae bacterium]